MAIMSIHCPIDMSFDLDDSLTLPPQDPSRQIETSTALVVDMPTIDAVAPGIDVCSVCMECYRPGEGGKQVPCGHVYHQTCIAEWSIYHNSCPLCRCKIFQDYN
ncbi:43kDa postsynaptic protein [Parasponia andersonii]|uniref:43kDa postsynaptic protein n=1 Tax=Parasponia andersonii TaxID=3476 RepID=A0A2P5B8Q4_PARAD|nr:43kDa postsynaptic protein [Parasponia andersonii]